MKIKVCDVVCNSVWFDPRVIRQLAEYQKDDEIELECIGLRCERYDVERIKAMGIRTNIVQMPPKYIGHLKTVTAKVMRECLRVKLLTEAIVEAAPDVIHANDLDALIPAVKAAKILKCKIVFDSHEICVENGRACSNALVHIYLAYCEKRIIHKVDQMVCVSHAAAEYFADKYQIPMPMVVTNCALKNTFAFDTTEKNEGFEALNHGQFYHGRGYDIMAEACALLKDYPEIKLAIRGFGDMEEEIRNTVNSRDNSENFRIYPKVDVRQLIPMASRSHVGVAVTEPDCLNFELSVSNKLFEYAAAGLPVILSDIPEHRYLNERYHFGLILPDNSPKSFAEAVICLYEDQDLYADLKRNAIAMTQSINWDDEFRKLIKVEKKLCK